MFIGNRANTSLVLLLPKEGKCRHCVPGKGPTHQWMESSIKSAKGQMADCTIIYNQDLLSVYHSAMGRRTRYWGRNSRFIWWLVSRCCNIFKPGWQVLPNQEITCFEACRCLCVSCKQSGGRGNWTTKGSFADHSPGWLLDRSVPTLLVNK